MKKAVKKIDVTYSGNWMDAMDCVGLGCYRINRLGFKSVILLQGLQVYYFMSGSYYSPWKLRQFQQIFHAGGVFAYPTESVYGLGCDPWNLEAVLDLLEIKHRDPTKGMILVASSADQLTPFVSLESSLDWERLVETRDRPTTWLVPASRETPWWIIGEHQTVAVRITGFSPVVQLCNSVNSALVSTSANLSGHPALKSAVSVRQSVGNQLDMLLIGKTGGVSAPSEIREFYSNKVVRS